MMNSEEWKAYIKRYTVDETASYAFYSVAAFADPSFGGSAHRINNSARRKHYFGNLDPYRMVANSEFQHPLDPAETFWRHDPYDNQGGEIEYDDAAISASSVTKGEQIIELREI